MVKKKVQKDITLKSLQEEIRLLKKQTTRKARKGLARELQTRREARADPLKRALIFATTPEVKSALRRKIRRQDKAKLRRQAIRQEIRFSPTRAIRGFSTEEAINRAKRIAVNSVMGKAEQAELFGLNLANSEVAMLQDESMQRIRLTMPPSPRKINNVIRGVTDDFMIDTDRIANSVSPKNIKNVLRGFPD